MAANPKFGHRIDVREHFARTRSDLLHLLGSLTPARWEHITAAAPWTVRDLAAHILGDDLNRLSRSRDAHPGQGPAPHESLLDFIHRINDEWVRGTARISPAMILAMLEATTPTVLEFWSSVDLDDVGEPVTWAGPDPAPVWLDCARDFTEYWVHQEQIREAVGERPCDDPDQIHTVLDTFLRAMPHTLEDCTRDEGTGVAVRVDGPGGGRWSWRYDGDEWLPTDAQHYEGTQVTFPEASTLWRLCTRMLTPAGADHTTETVGDLDLAERVLHIVSIIR